MHRFFFAVLIVYVGFLSIINAVFNVVGSLQCVSHNTARVISRLAVLFQFTSPLGCLNVDQLAVTGCQSGKDARHALGRAVVQHCAPARASAVLLYSSGLLFRDGDWLVCSGLGTVSSAGRDLCDIPRCPRRDPGCHAY